MHAIQNDHSANNLRLVFKDSVVSCSLAAGVTLGELAQKLSWLPQLRRGHAVAIDVTVPAFRGVNGRCS